MSQTKVIFKQESIPTRSGKSFLLDLNQSEEWTQLIESLPLNQQDIYFTPEYYRLYENNGNGKAYCFVYKEGENYCLNPFLKTELSPIRKSITKVYYEVRGVYGYNGIITNSEDPKFISNFHIAFNKFCIDSNIVTSFSRFHPLIKNESLSRKFDLLNKDRDVVALDLTQSYNDIFKNEYSTKARNMIRKSIKNQFKIEIIDNPTREEILEFKTIYIKKMESLNAKEFYFFSEQYFIDIFNILSKNAYLLRVVNEQNELMCASIFFHYKNYFHYHLSARSGIPDNSASSFMIDQAVQFAKSKNIKFLHMGGGRTSDPHDTLFHFKKTFSKFLLPFHYEIRIFNFQIYELLLSKY